MVRKSLEGGAYSQTQKAILNILEMVLVANPSCFLFREHPLFAREGVVYSNSHLQPTIFNAPPHGRPGRWGWEEQIRNMVSLGIRPPPGRLTMDGALAARSR